LEAPHICVSLDLFKKPVNNSKSQSINSSSFGLGAVSFFVAKYQRRCSGVDISKGLTKRPRRRSRAQKGALAKLMPRLFKTASRTSGQ